VKKTIVKHVAVILIILMPVLASAGELELPSLGHPYDYYAHFAVNAAIVSTLGVISKEQGNQTWMNLTFPILYATFISVAKELSDDRFGWDDMAADFAGMAAGSIIVIKW